jgi:hypothetical protein
MQKPPQSSTDDRVVPLHKTAASAGRRLANPQAHIGEEQPQIGDLDRYPQSEEADDYRHHGLDAQEPGLRPVRSPRLHAGGAARAVALVNRPPNRSGIKR